MASSPSPGYKKRIAASSVIQTKKKSVQPGAINLSDRNVSAILMKIGIVFPLVLNVNQEIAKEGCHDLLFPSTVIFSFEEYFEGPRFERPPIDSGRFYKSAIVKERNGERTEIMRFGAHVRGQRYFQAIATRICLDRLADTFIKSRRENCPFDSRPVTPSSETVW